MIYLKQYSTPNGTILAMCDEELIGRTLKGEGTELDLDKYSGFYKGELVDEAKAREMIDEDLYSANVVGERSMLIVVDKGLVKKDEIKAISNVPFVQIFKVSY